jgi:hypothetical protein
VSLAYKKKKQSFISSVRQRHGTKIRLKFLELYKSQKKNDSYLCKRSNTATNKGFENCRKREEDVQLQIEEDSDDGSRFVFIFFLVILFC